MDFNLPEELQILKTTVGLQWDERRPPASRELNRGPEVAVSYRAAAGSEIAFYRAVNVSRRIGKDVSIITAARAPAGERFVFCALSATICQERGRRFSMVVAVLIRLC